MVAAAQRRLAALAQQHAGDSPDTTGEPSADPEDPVPDSAAIVPSGATSTDGPRHIGAPRIGFSPGGLSAPHVTVAALAVLALVIAVAWWSLRSVPHSESVQLSGHGVAPAPTSPVTSLGPEPPSPPSTVAPAGAVTTGAAARLVIDVAGKVRQPGIVELPAGSRVVDAIAAAGGARPGVALTSLNLARMLVDGEQIVVGIDVPFIGTAPTGIPGGSTGTAGSAVTPVNLNTATAEQLDTLPGVGPVTAQAILAWRTDNGSFTSVDELLEVSGIGDATLADLRPYVYV